jgi:predicted RNase H-like nuclease (RuvC/YqgF family)
MVDFSDWSRKDQGQRQELLRTAISRIADDLERHGRYIEELQNQVSHMRDRAETPDELDHMRRQCEFMSLKIRMQGQDIHDLQRQITALEPAGSSRQ